MTDPSDDELWAAGLRDRTLGAIPPVPVDVPFAVRQGRRRRAVRTGAVRGGILVAACGLAFAVVPAVVSGLGSDTLTSGDSMEVPAASAASEALAGAADEATPHLTAVELAAEVRDGTPPSGTVVVVQEGVLDAGMLAGYVAAEDGDVSPAPAGGQQSRATVDCLEATGWPATLTERGWQVELEGDKAESFVAELATCVEASAP